MKFKTLCYSLIVICLAATIVFPGEFVVVKQPKKKESAAHVKEDIADQLESISRQINKNVRQSSYVQDQLFDKVKELVTQSDRSVFSGSTTELKECRCKLKNFYELLERQQADLETFLSCF